MDRLPESPTYNRLLTFDVGHLASLLRHRPRVLGEYIDAGFCPKELGAVLSDDEINSLSKSIPAAASEIAGLVESEFWARSGKASFEALARDGDLADLLQRFRDAPFLPDNPMGFDKPFILGMRVPRIKLSKFEDAVSLDASMMATARMALYGNFRRSDELTGRLVSEVLRQERQEQEMNMAFVLMAPDMDPNLRLSFDSVVSEILPGAQLQIGPIDIHTALQCAFQADFLDKINGHVMITSLQGLGGGLIAVATGGELGMMLREVHSTAQAADPALWDFKIPGSVWKPTREIPVSSLAIERPLTT